MVKSARWPGRQRRRAHSKHLRRVLKQAHDKKKSRRQGGDGDGVDDDVFAVRLLDATRQSLKVCHVLESRHTVEFVDLQ